jgi:acylphosphatase
MIGASLPPSGSLSYSTDVEGGLPVALRMRVRGHFTSRYLLFVCERAHWLSLSGWAADLGNGQAEIVAMGPEALVGALEMACILGPIDALIETVDTQTETSPIPAGFSIRPQ